MNHDGTGSKGRMQPTLSGIWDESKRRVAQFGRKKEKKAQRGKLRGKSCQCQYILHTILMERHRSTETACPHLPRITTLQAKSNHV